MESLLIKRVKLDIELDSIDYAPWFFVRLTKSLKELRKMFIPTVLDVHVSLSQEFLNSVNP